MGTKRRMTSSTSSSVVVRPRLNRTASLAVTAECPIASSTADGWIDPDVHAAPVDTETPARSSATTIDSPRAPANPALIVPPTRGAPAP